jgi:fatty-acyl-CoA synthase
VEKPALLLHRVRPLDAQQVELVDRPVDRLVDEPDDVALPVRVRHVEVGTTDHRRVRVVDHPHVGQRRRGRGLGLHDEHGRLLNAGEAIGELVSRNAASRFEGYYNNPEADAERTRNGWYWSGDLGYRDEADVFWFAGRNADWLRVDGENFAAAPIERILARFPGADGVAVYAVPDSRTGDQVMVALEMLAGHTFDPDAFATFLAEQRDLGTKWAPRYVRVVDALPVGATNKLDKRPLRAERWEAADPVYWRRPRSDTDERVTAGDADARRAEFVANQRANLLE